MIYDRCVQFQFDSRYIYVALFPPTSGIIRDINTFNLTPGSGITPPVTGPDINVTPREAFLRPADSEQKKAQDTKSYV